MVCETCEVKESMISSSTCNDCYKKWKAMKNYVMDLMIRKHGKLAGENYIKIKKEMQRLDKLWESNKDKTEFKKELKLINDSI